MFLVAFVMRHDVTAWSQHDVTRGVWKILYCTTAAAEVP